MSLMAKEASVVPLSDSGRETPMELSICRIGRQDIGCHDWRCETSCKYEALEVLDSSLGEAHLLPRSHYHLDRRAHHILCQLSCTCTAAY
eukprot:4800040-Prymnesium_polylepis.1